MVNRRLAGMLGFAMKAGRLVLGTELVLSEIKRHGKILLTLVSDSASEATKKRILSKCEFYKVKAVQINVSPEKLGELLGKSFAPVCIGVKDEGFAKEIAEAAKSAKAAVAN